MDFKIQLIIGAVILLALWTLLLMLRRNRLELKYALPWMFAATMVFIFNLFPGLTTKIAHAVGIDVPINMLFFLGFGFSLIIIFTLTVSVSRLSKKVKRLTQEQALLEKKINGVNSKISE